MCPQSDTLLLHDVSENFRNMFLKIYELGPAKYLSAPGLAWETAVKNTKVKLDLYMLLMVLEEEYVTLLNKYTKANNKYMRDYDKNKESSYF